MRLIDTIVRNTNRLDAIACVFDSKHRLSTQVATLLGTRPLFGKIYAHSNNVPYRFASVRAIPHMTSAPSERLSY